MAEREGFEPSLEFPLNTLSKRAPSATRPPLHLESCTALRRALHLESRKMLTLRSEPAEGFGWGTHQSSRVGLLDQAC